jgi:tripartite-type tricarboxylate transporter receptor subunit TctC
VRAVATDPELVARMTRLGVTVEASTPDELAKLLEQQRSQFGNVIKILGLKSAQ